MKSFPFLLSSFVIVSRNEGLCSNDCSPFSFPWLLLLLLLYTFSIVIIYSTLVLSLLVFSSSNGDGKQQSLIQHDHSNKTHTCTFSFVLVKWILSTANGTKDEKKWKHIEEKSQLRISIR